jgi:hypothetical protein
MKSLKKLAASLACRPLSKLDDLYRRNAGQECYIFGDGISLKWMDLHRFANRPSIIGNMVIYHKEASALVKPYCTITEPYWFYPIFPYRRPGKLPFFKHRMYRNTRSRLLKIPKPFFL